MAISQQDYQLKPNETIAQYNARIASLRGDTAQELASTQTSSVKYAQDNPNTAYASRLGEISSESLNNQNPIILPEKTETKVPTTTPIANLSGLPDYLQAFINTTTPPPSTAESYTKSLSESGITSAQQTVASNQNIVTQDQSQLQGIQSQLQAIQANGLAAQQTLESEAGTGKDITGTFLGRQQQEISRQTAIQSLPLESQALAIQAKITSDQGNLTYSQDLLNQATNKLDTLYKLYSDDATNLYNYKQNLINVVYDYASKQEQAALDAQKTAESQAFTTQQNNLNYSQTIANTAITNGQANIASQIMKLDPTSPTYMNDVSTLAGQIQPKAETISLSDTLKLQETVTAQNAALSGSLDNYSLVNSILESKNLAQLSGKAQAASIPLIGGLLTSNETKLAQNQLLQLKGVLSLANRQTLKGQGTISDFEGKMLANAASSLGITDKGTTNLSETDLKKQLAIVKGAFATAAGMEASVKVTSSSGEIIHTSASRNEIDNLILEGNTVEYE